ncbi:MAG: hypothetical protein P1P65_00830 [Treponema sp.]
MTELELYEIYEKAKKARIYLTSGEAVEGKVYGFTQAIDNDPEIASIALEDENGQLHGYCQDEIDSIEVME